MELERIERERRCFTELSPSLSVVGDDVAHLFFFFSFFSFFVPNLSRIKSERELVEEDKIKLQGEISSEGKGFLDQRDQAVAKKQKVSVSPAALSFC